MSSTGHSISLKIVVFILFGIINCTTIMGQTAKLSGKMTDSLDQPLVHTNLIATSLDEEENSAFAISGEQGEYQLKLRTHKSYKIEITSLGYSSITDTLTITENTSKNYILSESSEELEEVVIEAKMAMVVKDDTITYRTDHFKQGDERKLREMLKKLPGVEVDYDGNVKVNGKPVNKLMVDGKDFFGGNVKLGVNNIPADAVEEIDAIDHYQEVEFMKGLKDSELLAMNVKLKEDKKEFAFGETEVGGGTKNRYYVNPNIFYYSPKTTANFIGSFNNTNKTALSWQDVNRFKGEYTNSITNPVNSSDAGLEQFSSSRDLQHKKTIFGAFNFSRKINSELDLEAYSIVSKEKEQAKTTANTTYLAENDITENRATKNKQKGFSNFNKVRLRYQPNKTNDLAYDVLMDASNHNLHEEILSEVGPQSNETYTSKDPRNIELSQYLRYNSQPKFEHTSEVNAFYTFKKKSALTNWDFDQPIFPDIIPTEEYQDDYNFLQDYSSTTHTGQADYKHYWVLNSTNHIYPIAGLSFHQEDYNTTDSEILQDGTHHPFTDNNFNNAIEYGLTDPYVGFQYKIQLGEFILRPGVVYHHYFWHVQQFKEKIASKNKGVLSPEFKAEIEPKLGQRIKFKYNLESSFGEAADYANRLRLTNFNSLYRGNKELENNLYHKLSLRFQQVMRSRRFFYNFNFHYTRKEKSIQQATALEGINQVSTAFYSNLPENSYNFTASLQKSWPRFLGSFTFQTYLSDYSQIVNENPISYHSNIYAFKLNGRTDFKKWPNITAGIQQVFKNTKSENYNSNYWSADPYIDIRYAFLNGFIFKTDYTYSYTHEKSNNQQFDLGNASLFYRKEDSPWGFEVKAENIFDMHYKRNYQSNEFTIYDYRTYIQPRTVLFILSYQL